MILTDTGPLVALLDKDDSRHTDCISAAKLLPSGPMLTTWPCFTEAMYLLGAVGGYHYQSELWRLRTNGRVALYELSGPETDRMAALMQKYRDTPMDLADASIVAAAETLKMVQVFTLDGHFRIYRLGDGSAIHVVP